MHETLFPYYEREVLYLRQLVQEFSQRFPAAANRLLLEPNRSADPHVERLLESFALLAGRVQHKLDDEFPEIAVPLLQTLAPHFLAPVPSLAVLQFDLDAARAAMPQGFVIARHSLLHTAPVDSVPCQFRTAYPVTLWPIQLTSAVFQGPPFPRELKPPPGAAAVLRLRFACQGGLTFAALTLEKLRLFLHGDLNMLPPLYTLLFNHVLQVVFQPPAPTPQSTLVLSPDRCLAPGGFAPEESLFTDAPPSRLGYHQLKELFVFPAKFWFVDMRGWDQAARRGWRDQCDVIIWFDRTVPLLEKSIDAGSFRLGCTPVVNLVPLTVQATAVDATQADFRLTPDIAYPRGYEVFAVDAVSSHRPAEHTTRVYPPFFSIRHPRTADQDDVYWYTSRWPSLAENDHGTLVNLHLVDLDFRPRPPTGALEVQATCTNRDLPNQLRRAGEALQFEAQAAWPLTRIRCLRPPTPPLRPEPRRGRFWNFVSHLSLNYLSLAEEGKGREALQEILGLYDFSDPKAGQQHLGAVTRQFIDGIAKVSSRRVIGRLERERISSFCRGLEIEVELEEDKYPGVGVYLFASVLERFLAHYVSVHSFTQLVAKSAKQGEPFKHWPPRAGERPSL